MQILFLGKENNHMGPNQENSEGAGQQVFFYQPKIHVLTALNGLAHCRGEETRFLFAIFLGVFYEFFLTNALIRLCRIPGLG